MCTMRASFRTPPSGIFKFIRTRELSSHSVSAPPNISEPELQSATNYCSELLRKYDSPSYTLQTFIPPAARTAYLAIRALNVELARIPDTTSTPAIGSMRIQFWRDNVTSAFAGHPAKHPVPMLLSHAISSLSTRTAGAAQLSKPWFQRLISAREQYLSNRPYPSLDALEQYAENTYSTLLYLTLSALPLSSLAADHVASHIGKASGIVAVLRGIPLLAFPPPPNHHSNPSLDPAPPHQPRASRQGAVTLPLDVLAVAGVRDEDVLRSGADAPGLRDAVFAVATRASDHLITARHMLQELQAGREAGHAYEHESDAGHAHEPDVHEGRGHADDGHAGAAASRDMERAFGVLMPAVATGLWLRRLEAVDFDVFDAGMRRREWRLPWRAYWAWRRRMF